MTVFIQPPSYAVLEERLLSRGTEDSLSLEKRLAKVRHELTYFDKFDKVLVNDDLAKALNDAEELVKGFVHTYGPANHK